MSSAVVGLALAQALPSRVNAVVGLLMVATALPLALGNNIRPLLTGGSFSRLGREDPAEAARSYYPTGSILHRSRADLYFEDGLTALEPSWMAAAASVNASSCRAVGIDATSALDTYPMFALLGAGSGQRDVRYVDIHNRSAAYASAEPFQPCAIVCLRRAYSPEKWSEYGPREGWGRQVFGELLVVRDSEFPSGP